MHKIVFIYPGPPSQETTPNVSKVTEVNGKVLQLTRKYFLLISFIARIMFRYLKCCVADCCRNLQF